MNLVGSLPCFPLILFSFAVLPCTSQLRPYSIANDIRVNALLSSQDRLAGVRRLAPSTELVREEPVGSGRVVVLGRPYQDPEQGADEFGEWATPSHRDVDGREDETAGGRRTRIGSRRLSPSGNSRRFKPSQPLQNSNPVHLRRQQGVGKVQPGQVEEKWISSQGEAVEGERWEVQEQAEQSWLPPQQSVRHHQQQEEERWFYNEQQQQEEQRFNNQPLTERLAGQRNPRSSYV